MVQADFVHVTCFALLHQHGPTSFTLGMFSLIRDAGALLWLRSLIWSAHRELNLVRDECTEPVVRENLDLQQRLAALAQAKADLEDLLGATRSEVSLPFDGENHQSHCST